MAPRPPLDELLALFQATVAREGVTTGPGAGAGNSIIDAGIAGSGANSFLSMLMVLYPGRPRLVDSMDITGFVNGTGEVIFSTAYKGVAAPIPAGVPYKIVTFRFVPAEVAAIEAKLDSGVFGLAALKAVADAILVDTGTTLEGKLDALALICTAARGLLLDRLSIITAGGAGELTPARAGYLDNIAPTAVGRLQIKATTIDLGQIAGTYDLFTATAQDVVVEKLVIRMSGGTLVGSNLTSILIQTDDATPIVLIDAVAGAVANLTNEAQLAWTGAMLLDAGTSAKIRLTIAGGAATAAKVCDVIAECRAVVAGGYLT